MGQEEIRGGRRFQERLRADEKDGFSIRWYGRSRSFNSLQFYNDYIDYGIQIVFDTFLIYSS
jgi:hypothetical protein